MKIKIMSMVIAVIICFCSIVPAFADGETTDRPTGTQSAYLHYTDEFTVEGSDRASYFHDKQLALNTNAVGQITISLSVTAVSTMKKLGFTVLKLQHWNGSSWEDVWSVSDQYSLNTDYFAYLTTRSGLVSNDFYQVTVELYAKKGFLQVQKQTITSNYILCN